MNLISSFVNKLNPNLKAHAIAITIYQGY